MAMRDHYGPYSHPVLVDIPVEPPTDLLSEMDIIADELRANPDHIEDDDQIAFRQLQRIRDPGLNSGTEWLDVFGILA